MCGKYSWTVCGGGVELGSKSSKLVVQVVFRHYPLPFYISLPTIYLGSKELRIFRYHGVSYVQIIKILSCIMSEISYLPGPYLTHGQAGSFSCKEWIRIIMTWKCVHDLSLSLPGWFDYVFWKIQPAQIITSKKLQYRVPELKMFELKDLVIESLQRYWLSCDRAIISCLNLVCTRSLRGAPK